MAKAERNARTTSKRPVPAANSQNRVRLATSKAQPHIQHHSVNQARADSRADWAADLVFDVREPKLAVSLRLDADVLRFFRGLGAGYQTRINEVLKAFMHAREDVEISARMAATAKASRAVAHSNGKRARQA